MKKNNIPKELDTEKLTSQETKYLEDKTMKKNNIPKELDTEKLTPQETKYLVTTTINIVGGPNSSKLLGFQSEGEVVALEEKDGWVRTSEGWLNKKFLRLVE